MVPPFTDVKDQMFCLQINGKAVWEWRKIKARLTEKGLHAVYLGTFPHVYSMLRSSSEQKQFKLNRTILYIVTNQVVCTLQSLRIMGGIQNLIICVKMALACEASVSSRVVRAGAKKKWKGEGEGRRGNACPQTPRFWKTPLDISRFCSFVN